MITEKMQSCFGCKHNQAGRWVGWACRKGVPENDEDYSCWEKDEDEDFWRKKLINSYDYLPNKDRTP